MNRKATDPIADAIKTCFASLDEEVCLIAYSGGIDSAVLLHASASYVAQHQHRVLACYIGHPDIIQNDKLSEKKSKPEKRQEILEGFCRELEVPLVGADIDRDFCMHLAESQGLEAAYRTGRYELLHACAIAYNANLILLAHHSEDVAESVFMQLLRGRALSMTGIPRSRELVFPRGYTGPVPFPKHACEPQRPIVCKRPMLECRKSDIADYAKRHAIAIYHDPQNSDQNRTRNFLRHEILSRLGTHFPNYVQALHNVSTDIQELQSYNSAVLPRWKISGSRLSYSRDIFIGLPRVLQYDLLHTGMHLLTTELDKTELDKSASPKRIGTAQFADFFSYIENLHKRDTQSPIKNHGLQEQGFTLSANRVIRIDEKNIYLQCNKERAALYIYIDISKEIVFDIEALLGDKEIHNAGKKQEIKLQFTTPLVCLRRVADGDIDKNHKKRIITLAKKKLFYGYCIEDQHGNKVLLLPEMLPIYRFTNYNNSNNEQQYSLTLRYYFEQN